MSTSTKSPKTLSSPSAENKSTSTTATTSDTQSSPALLEVIEQQEHAGKLFVKSGRIKRTLVRKPRLSLRDLLSARRDAGSVRSQTSSVAQKLRKKDLEITKLKAIKEPKTLQALVEIICEKQPHKEIKRDALARELQAQGHRFVRYSARRQAWKIIKFSSSTATNILDKSLADVKKYFKAKASRAARLAAATAAATDPKADTVRTSRRLRAKPKKEPESTQQFNARNSVPTKRITKKTPPLTTVKTSKTMAKAIAKGEQPSNWKDLPDVPVEPAALVSYQGIRVYKPEKWDVLVGRGSSIAMHAGNRMFRKIVWMHKHDYDMAPRIEKLMVAERVLGLVAAMGARFLEKNEDEWIGISLQRCMQKTSQALRERKWVAGVSAPSSAGN